MEIVVGGGGGGEKLYSQNLRDFLRIKEEDHQRNLNQTTASSSGSGGGRRSSSGLTLSAVLGEKTGQPPPVDEPPPLPCIQSNRTLLDIIREDQTSGLGGGRGDGRSSWRHLRDKIRHRRRAAAAAWSSAVPIPSSDVPLNDNNRMPTTATTRQPSIRFNSAVDAGESTQPDARATERASGRFEQTSSLPRRRLLSEHNQHHHHENGEQRGGDAAEGEAEEEGSPEQPVRTSLMALLAENDRQMGLESPAYMMDEAEGEAEEETTAGVGGGGGVNGGEYNNCCVCMVRHKGAAFIPCGHTFCRLCSRELWVQRGNCPLCNNYILEILDIF